MQLSQRMGGKGNPRRWFVVVGNFGGFWDLEETRNVCNNVGRKLKNFLWEKLSKAFPTPSSVSRGTELVLCHDGNRRQVSPLAVDGVDQRILQSLHYSSLRTYLIGWQRLQFAEFQFRKVSGWRTSGHKSTQIAQLPANQPEMYKIEPFLKLLLTESCWFEKTSATMY